MADETKTFRVHLKTGNSFTVKAHHFERAQNERFTFYKSESEVDKDIWLYTADVIAIVPDNPPVIRSSSSSRTM